jgi:hypothetical protein
MNSARRHLIYTYLLRECCLLSEPDSISVEKVWGITRDEAQDELIRTVPSRIAQIIIMPELSRMFDYDLHGMPGFWYDHTKELITAWKLNLNRAGLFRPYTDERGRIQGLYVYRAAWDASPRLLSSQGLTLGTEAIQPERLAA